LTLIETEACMSNRGAAVFMPHLLSVHNGAKVLGDQLAELVQRLLTDRLRQC
jgi:hypothetical protein